MEGVYGRCWTAAAKESAYQRLNVGPDTGPAASMPGMGTLFGTGCFKPFPLLAEPPYVNLLKGFLSPTDDHETHDAQAAQTLWNQYNLTLRMLKNENITFNPVFNNTFNRRAASTAYDEPPSLSPLSAVQQGHMPIGDVLTRHFKGYLSGQSVMIRTSPRDEKKSSGIARNGQAITTLQEIAIPMMPPAALRGPGGGSPWTPYNPSGKIADKGAVHRTTWNTLLKPIVKNSFESFAVTPFSGKIKPPALPKISKTLHAVFNRGILNVHNRDSNINTDIHTTGSDILNTFRTVHHGKTDHARHIIQQMKQEIDSNNSEQRTVNRMDSLHKDIRVFSGSQEKMMTDISNQLTGMNRKIDTLQTQQKRTGPLIRTNPNAKDGGFYDY